MDMKMSRMRLLIATAIVMLLATVAGCGGRSASWRQMDVAESVMEAHPDSALAILNGIDAASLGNREEPARYALLKSMALDKNYIDTTTFDVLQPAIDYYLRKGTPDEKLRTYYYQGRIFQNRGEGDNALSAFTHALDNSAGISDSLCLARTLMAQACMFFDLYDWGKYIDNHLRASKIYEAQNRPYLEFDCLLDALNGANVLNNKELADSLIGVCEKIVSVDSIQNVDFRGYKLSYIIRFGSKREIKNLIETQGDFSAYDVNGRLNLAFGYNKLGDNVQAKHILESIYKSGEKFDTLRYQAILIPVLRDLGDFEGAFTAYCEYSQKTDSIFSLQFEQKSRLLSERHDFELHVKEAENQKTQIIWGGVGLAMLLCIVILGYALYVKRLKFEHANDLLRIQNLQSTLFEKDKQHEEMSNKIGNLFSTRFKLLDGLASSYFECKETGQEQKRIYAEVKNSIVDFSSEITTQELIDVVNGYKSGLMDNFKADYPKLSASQYRLALYLFCGFSLSSISIFIDSDLRNIYVYKSRLKSLIAKGESPRKEEYLRYFA